MAAIAAAVLLGMTGCIRKDQDTLFERIPSSVSGVAFRNDLHPTESFNMYIFRNFFNGGGVAIGDVDGDGRPDLFLTGNMTTNRLYLNQGGLRFEDATDLAGLRSDGWWSTGASMADVDGDGDLDLFVAMSGPPNGVAGSANEGLAPGAGRHNRLYINDGRGRFVDRAADWGVAHTGLGTSAVFFDADRDGWLDLLLLSNPIAPLDSFSEATGAWRHEGGGDLRFYRNAGGRFIERTLDAGFHQSRIMFPLSASVGDVDGDGSLDVFVANDFVERDHLYMNDGSGAFTEIFFEPTVRSSSLSSMGSDMADLDNDGRLDLYVADMRPANERRLKSKMTFESWDEHQEQQSKDFGTQHTRNTLFRNTAAGDGFRLSELSRLSRTESTDWSWSALIADFDLNGWNDIYVTNGIGKDLLDQDYLMSAADPRMLRERIESGRGNVIMALLEDLSSEPLPNHLFANSGGFSFEDVAGHWGLGEPGFSSGAAWGDLDGDGDLDLVVSNTDGEARVYANRAMEKGSRAEGGLHSLRIDLQGPKANRLAIGARATVWSAGRTMVREHQLQRGFQSSVEPGLFFGLGSDPAIDSIHVRWPDGDRTLLAGAGLDAVLRASRPTSAEGGPLGDQPGTVSFRRIALKHPSLGAPVDVEASPAAAPDAPARSYAPSANAIFTPADPAALGLDYRHEAYDYNDFRREPLLFHMRSTEGPALCAGDVNGDGLEDVYLGGARDQAGSLFLQTSDRRFRPVLKDLFAADRTSEEVDCAFFDANGDGLDDLYIVSGGNSLVQASSALGDRLYLTQPDGRELLVKSPQLLPSATRFESTSVVAPHDFNGDGNLDLFVGTRLKPFSVGVPVNGYLLQGDGQGGFRDITAAKAPELQEIGMITHAVWADLHGDGSKELAVAGEYMPIRVFSFRDGEAADITSALGLEGTSGWWNRLIAGDWNGDGREDLIGLNHGLNSLFRASKENPVRMWVSDFSGNGLLDHVLSISKEGRDYPVALRHDMAAQIPGIGARFPTYAAYAGKSVQELFKPQELKDALLLQAEWMATSRFMSGPDSVLTMDPLPLQAQLSPMYGGASLTVEGRQMLLIGGNLHAVKPQTGSYDASIGAVVDPKTLQEIRGTGFRVDGEVREILPVRLGPAGTSQELLIIVARYDDAPVVFKVRTGRLP